MAKSRLQKPANDNALVPVRLWFGFAMMCIGMFMAILDVQIVATSLPTIRSALGIPADAMSWVQTAYLIAEVIAIPLTGFLTRLMTMRGLYTVAITIFTVASIGCALSDSFTSLIVWRVIQGFAGGTLIPAVFSAVFLVFPVKAQGLATTIAGVIAVLAPTVGPIVGGWITDTTSWHWLFLINVIPGFASAVVAWTTLNRDKPDSSVIRGFGGLAFVMMALSLAMMEIALKEAPHRGWTSPVVLTLIAVTVSAAGIFLWRSWISKTPVVDVRLLKDTRFALGCVLGFVLGIGLYGNVYMMPLFLAFVRGHSAFDIGTIMLVSGVAQLIAAPFVVAIEQRSDPRLLTIFGFLLFAYGLYLSSSQTIATDYDEMFWPQIIRGIGIMFCLLPPTRLALGHLSPDKVPDGSGLFNLTRNLGGAIGLALIDTIIFGRLKGYVSDITSSLMSGDIATATQLGLTQAQLTGPDFMNDAMQAEIGPLIRKLAFTEVINDAWWMVAAMTLAVLVLMPVAWLKSARVR